MDNNTLAKKASDIIKKAGVVSFGIIDEQGYPTVSAVSLIKPDGINELYFSTSTGSNKENRLLANNMASMCCFTRADNVTLVGKAEIMRDQETKSKFWLDWFVDHYPQGPTDPSYIIIKFTAHRASLWIDQESAEFNI